MIQLNIHRQRITTSDKKVLDDEDKTLKEMGIREGDELEIKDLGPQICEYSRDWIWMSIDATLLALQLGEQS